MKRMMTLLLAAGLVLGAGMGSAKAVELTANGTWQFGWSWMQGLGGDSADTSDTFKAKSRLRTQFNFIASEELQGVLQLEIGNADWGGENGWATGTDGVNLKVRYAYVDWMVPNTDLHVRMGLQPMSAPMYTFNGTVLCDAEMAALTASYQFNEMVGVTLAWMRPYNDDSESHDAIDLFLLSLPVTGDGWAVTPYGIVGSVARHAMEGVGTNIDGEWGKVWGAELGYLQAGLLPVGAIALPGDKAHGVAWWAGIGGELTMFDPFRVALDFVYGSVDLGDNNRVDLKRSGWAVSGEASYALDFVTPKVGLWYASGDDANPYDGSERMPFIYPSNAINNFGFDGGWYDADQISVGSVGMWGASLQFNDIQLIDGLYHDLRGTYVQGTNNRAMAAVAGAPIRNYEGMYLTTGDSAWEIDFDTKYDIYKNLALHVELSYINLDLDEAAWGHVDSDAEEAYKAGIYLTYKF